MNVLTKSTIWMLMHKCVRVCVDAQVDMPVIFCFWPTAIASYAIDEAQNQH